MLRIPQNTIAPQMDGLLRAQLRGLQMQVWNDNEQRHRTAIFVTAVDKYLLARCREPDS